jgi:hypothetical protein
MRRRVSERCGVAGCDGMTVENSLASLIERLELDASLAEPRNLRGRFAAMDALDVYLGDEPGGGTAVQRRAREFCAELEGRNLKLYEAIRGEIQRGAGGAALREWMADSNGAGHRMKFGGYDYLDEFVSGVLRLEEPVAAGAGLEPEMVAYQPTPARHIFDLIGRAGLTERDLLIDLGSGLGQVTLVAAICTKARCLGIEVEAGYVDCARKSARSLNLENAEFVAGDVRTAELSEGTVFYLYTPFRGAMLREVLELLRAEAGRREIRVGTYGPCTRVVGEEPWLRAVGPVDAERVALFQSCR